MSSGSKDGKQYGLVLPKKASLSAPKAGNIFGEDSGSEGDAATDWVKKALKAEGEKNLLKKQTRLTMRKAMKEDPTVYQYDEVYDDMERSKVEGKASKKAVEQKPKYIENLLKAAERRKREQEHRVERLVQKEREAEGAMFADKESFVTSAYRAKLEEFKKMEEEDKRMDRLEAIGDVTKQQDMAGFYRHLYHQTVDRDGKDDDKKSDIKEQADKQSSPKGGQNEDPIPKKDDTNMDRDDPLTASDGDSNSGQEGNEEAAKEARMTTVKIAKKRQYRKRMAERSESSSEDEPEKKTELAEPRNFEKNSIDKKEQPDVKKHRPSHEETQEVDGKVEKIVESNGDNLKDSKRERTKPKDGHVVEKSTNDSLKVVEKPEQPSKPKVSIWEKRTVGPIFETALERYYVRKAERLN